MKPEHFVEISRLLLDNPKTSQRELSARSNLSLGLVNSIIKESVECGFLVREEPRKIVLTQEGLARLETNRVKSAIILSAGFGSRFVPLTYEIPKGLLAVHGQPMIERQIEQLQDKGITEIVIVVGYKKERFDYLIDKYGVRLVFNKEYAVKNNLASLYCALPWLDSTYISSSDLWIENNIFNTYESRNWCSCIYKNGPTDEWCVKVSPTDKIEAIEVGGHDSFVIVGPAYFTSASSAMLKQYVTDCYNRPGTQDFFWEQTLIEHASALPININRQTGNVFEFENFEELKKYDLSYGLASEVKGLRIISKVFNTIENEIENIQPVKEGMTNRSFTFTFDSTRYIMRIPGEGTDKLIDRKKEYSTYQVISPLGFCDDLVYIDPEEGYKISKYIEGARTCDPQHMSDVASCMKKLRELHSMELVVDHSFDIFEQIEFYESLWIEPTSCFRDYSETKANVMGLKLHIDAMEKTKALSHIDSVPDNFLFTNEGGKEQIHLIDWEYSGMHDPHVDIAMFAIYSMYDKNQIDALIDCYFISGCSDETRTKIYAYISACGLLWSNWCEYKSHMGVEFGDYATRQYRYAKDYFRIANDRLQIHKQ